MNRGGVASQQLQLQQQQQSSPKSFGCVLPLAVGTAVALGTAAATFYLVRLKKKVKLGSAVWSKSWFSELSCMWPGQSFSLKIHKQLYDGNSTLQRIQVFDCGPDWGKILVLDGVIQVTEKDEPAYQEMMAHVPVMTHPNPRRVLVIGGGDGGILRELSRHRSIEEMHICEIDKSVIDISKKFLPGLACGFNDPRVQIHIQDGFEYLKRRAKAFDVVIVDSSDPVGPAEGLFKEPFYRAAFDALTEYGVLCCQGESIWLHLNLIREITDFASKYFPIVEYANLSVPSYPCGSIGMICCSKDSRFRFSAPKRELEDEILNSLKFYNTEIHRAAFCLPSFAKRMICGTNGSSSSGNPQQPSASAAAAAAAAEFSSVSPAASSPLSPAVSV